MKNEIIVTEEQRSLIVEIFNSKLSEAEKDLLSACCVLCTYGVSKRDIQRVLDLEPSVLCAQVDTLLHEGFLVALGSDIIFAPQEVKRTVLAIHPVPISMFNRIVENLYYRTFPSMYTDGLQLKPFFDMAEGIIDYVIEYSVESFDWELIAKFVKNYCFGYEIYGRIEFGIHNKAELLVMRALHLVKTRIKGELYIDLTLLQALQWVYGFFYSNANELLDEVDAIRKSTGLRSSEPLYHFVKGVYYEHYGLLIKAYSEFYQAYEESTNGENFGYLRSYISIFLAYLCSLADDQSSALSWLDRVHWSIIPQHNVIRYFYHLTSAMLTTESVAETELKRAEECIAEVNPDALVLARTYYCWSIYYAHLGQARRSSRFYLSYSNRLARFASTEAAFVIHKAGEISRMVSENSLVTARRLLNKLDRINLKDKDIAISVRLQCCEAYVECLAAVGMTRLVSAYSELALEIINDNQPKKDEVSSVAKVFEGENLPSTLSEMAFYFNMQRLKNEIEEVKKQAVQPGCLSREANIFKGIKEEICSMKIRFPEYRVDMDVIAAHIVSLTNPQQAIIWWLKIVHKAKGEQKIRVALSAANYCSEIGYYWEAKKILESAMADNYAFQVSNEGLRIALLIELANVTEIAGFRTVATKMWEDLIVLTKDTELESKVLFHYAVNALDYKDFSMAELLIDRSIACYEQEEACLDETFSSLLAYRSVILSGMGRYSEARTAILDAMKFYPDLSNKSSFNLWYNLTWYYIAIQEDSAARETLAKASSLWGIGESEKEQLNELYEILSQPWEKKAMYFQNSMGIDLD